MTASEALTAGPEGFCMANFPGSPACQTEVPNLGLQKSGQQKGTKRPAAADATLPRRSMKRPAGAAQEALSSDAVVELLSDDDAAPEAASHAPVANRCYAKMHYKTGKAAIRQGYGQKRQICQFGGLAYSKVVLYGICDKIIAQLKEGSLEESDAKEACEKLLA